MTAPAKFSIRDFATGFTCAVAYFVVPILLGSLLPLAFFLWFVGVYICLCTLVAAVLIGIPLGLLAAFVTSRACGVAVHLIAFFVAGAVTAVVACGIVADWSYGRFAPLGAFGPRADAGVVVLVVFAATCSALGWLTADRHSHAAPFDDALRGHTIEEFAALLDQRGDAGASSD